MSGNERSTEQLTAVTDCRDLVRSAAAAQRLPSRDLDTSLVAGGERGRRVAAFAGGSVLVVGAVTALHNLYRSGDDAAELIAWSGLLLLALTALGGGIKLAMWGARPVITALFDAAKARLTEFGRTVVAAGSVIAGALGMWWTFRGGYASWWQQVSGEHRWTLLLGVGQMLVAVAAGAALFAGGRYVTGLAKDALTDSGLLIERDRAAGRRRAPEGLWHPGLVAALVGGGLGLVLLAAGITPRLYVWITGPDVLPAVAAIAAVLVWGIGSNLGWWKGLAGLWQWATDASHKTAATSGVVALLMFSAGGLGLGWFTPATVPQAHAQCPPDCGGGSNGGSYGPDASQFQPPQMPGQMPDYQGGINQPPLDQNSSISIYNTQAPSVSNNGVQGSSGQQGPQQGWDQPANGTQIPDYQTATPYTQGPGRPNPDFNPGSQGGQANPGSNAGSQGGQPNQGVQQQAPQQPQENPAQQPDQQPQQSDSQRIDDLTRQLQDQQQQSAQDRQRIDDLTKQLQQQNKQNQKQQQSPRFPSKDDKKDRDQQDRDNQSGDNDLSALLLGAASTRRRKQDDQEQGPDTEALGQDAAQAAQSLPGDVTNYVSDGTNLASSAGQAAQGYGQAAQAGASIASSAQSGAVNPMDAVQLVQGVAQGVQGTADAVNSGSQIVKTAQGQADQVAQAIGDANPQLKPQIEQFTQLNDQASQVTDLVGQGAQLTSQGAGAVNSVSSLGASGMPTDAAGEAPAEMVGWATTASGPAGSGPATFGGPQPGLPAPADPPSPDVPIDDVRVPLIEGQPITIEDSVSLQNPDLLALGDGRFVPIFGTDSGPAIFTWTYQGAGPTNVLSQTTNVWVNGQRVENPLITQSGNMFNLTLPNVSDGDEINFRQDAVLEWTTGGVVRTAPGHLQGWLVPQVAPGDAINVPKATAAELGKQGINAVGLGQNTERITPVTPSKANYRVPDVLDRGAGIIGEVKNVGKQALTAQLRDYLAFAQTNGLTFHLFVRQGEGTTLTGPLQALVDSGVIKLHKVI
ncbi:putative toxin [Mycobacteroides abscessus]|uniref:putative toxin n=1 Tax=Mycobacteroides abscessus TaxID=36809 RepID=UPI0009A75D2B|nr:putative toxin [Mycobacteroides abscessus]